MINLFAIPHSAPSGDLAIGFSACVGMVGGQESIVATGGQQNSSNTPRDQTALPLLSLVLVIQQHCPKKYSGNKRTAEQQQHTRGPDSMAVSLFQYVVGQFQRQGNISQKRIAATGGRQNSNNTPRDHTALPVLSFSIWFVSFRDRTTLPKKGYQQQEDSRIVATHQETRQHCRFTLLVCGWLVLDIGQHCPKKNSGNKGTAEQWQYTKKHQTALLVLSFSIWLVSFRDTAMLPKKEQWQQEDSRIVATHQWTRQHRRFTLLKCDCLVLPENVSCSTSHEDWKAEQYQHTRGAGLRPSIPIDFQLALFNLDLCGLLLH